MKYTMKKIIKNLIDKIYSREEPPKMTWWTKPEYNGLIYTAPPIPATKHFPKVFRNMPRNNPGYGFPTAKQCPAFVDLYKHTYILPMWCDVNLNISAEKIEKKPEPVNNRVNKGGNTGGVIKPKLDSTINDRLQYEWETPSQEFFFETHGNNQFLDFMPESKKDWKFVWKPHCPWNMKTPKGYSVFQLPMTYEFNPDFEVMSGIIDTDIHHEINQQIVQKRMGTIEIKRGTPLCMYLPFKRDKFNLEVVLETQELWSMRIKNFWNMWSKFGATKSKLGGYREAQKDQAKELDQEYKVSTWEDRK